MNGPNERYGNEPRKGDAEDEANVESREDNLVKKLHIFSDACLNERRAEASAPQSLCIVPKKKFPERGKEAFIYPRAPH